jgi:two-component system, cell cycle response regulator
MNVETTASSSPKILVVDDDVVIQHTVAMALNKAGYQVSIARDISAALSAARREKPDLLLLDISFPLDPANFGGPSQDGLFVMQWLQRTPETKIIPTIIISGSDPLKYKDQVSPSSIVAWFRKPLNHEELLATIKTALAKKPVAVQPISPEI